MMTLKSWQCEIYTRKGHFYVRDLGSANGTYVDERKISQEAELYSGCTLALGEAKFAVEILPM